MRSFSAFWTFIWTFISVSTSFESWTVECSLKVFNANDTAESSMLHKKNKPVFAGGISIVSIAHLPTVSKAENSKMQKADR